MTLVELGFEIARHPGIAALTGNGKMFAVGDNRALITQKNGLGHIRGYAGLRLPEAASREWMSRLNAFAEFILWDEIGLFTASDMQSGCETRIHLEEVPANLLRERRKGWLPVAPRTSGSTACPRLTKLMQEAREAQASIYANRDLSLSELAQSAKRKAASFSRLVRLNYLARHRRRNRRRHAAIDTQPTAAHGLRTADGLGPAKEAARISRSAGSMELQGSRMSSGRGAPYRERQSNSPTL